MQQDASNPKQLIVERVRQSTNILVAVSANPSVDALAAALGLTLMLNKLDKHATAVFSGALPPAMEFLQPGKTFENSVDSLRDFIISLDKEKADRLRYKVEDDVVRIFITPYRTTITNKDLQFSQGDFNVDLILALGVEKRDDLDKAIIAHGRILHDATVMTINPNNVQSSLGAVDWHEPGASSLCEMLVILADALQHPGMLDQQSATALLTGIVAATDRFSNEHTTPQVMTMAAQLMAAGANQQLIANNLVKAHELASTPNNGKLVADAPSIKVASEQPRPDGELDIAHAKKDDATTGAAPVAQPAPEQKPAGQQQAKSDNRPAKNKKGRGGRTPEEELAAALPSSAAAASAFNELRDAIESDSAAGAAKAPGSQTVNGASANEDEDQASQQPEGYVVGNSSWRGRRLEPPSLGGTLNATAEQALDDSIKSQEAERNQKLLTHPDSPKTKAKQITPPSAETPPEPKPQKSAEPAKPAELTDVKESPKKEEAVTAAPAPVVAPEPTPVVQPAPEILPEPAPAAPPEPAPAPLPEPALQPVPQPVAPPEAVNEQPQPEPAPAAPTPVDLDAARKAVDEALSAQPFDVAGQPLESVGAAPLDTAQAPTPAPVAAEAPVFTQPLPEPPAPVQVPDAAPAATLPADVLPPLPPMPPLPQHDPSQPLAPPPSLDSLPPLPPEATVIPPTPLTPTPTPVAAPEPAPPAQPQAPADPKQFQIPM